MNRVKRCLGKTMRKRKTVLLININIKNAEILTMVLNSLLPHGINPYIYNRKLDQIEVAGNVTDVNTAIKAYNEKQFNRKPRRKENYRNGRTKKKTK